MMGVDRFPFPSLVDLNVISINLNTSVSVQAQGMSWETITANHLFNDLVGSGVLRFPIFCDGGLEKFCRWHLTDLHTTDQCQIFKNFLIKRENYKLASARRLSSRFLARSGLAVACSNQIRVFSRLDLRDFFRIHTCIDRVGEPAPERLLRLAYPPARPGFSLLGSTINPRSIHLREVKFRALLIA
jgi:hypothetical protein